MKSKRRKLKKSSESSSDNDNTNSLFPKSKQSKINEEADIIFNNNLKNNDNINIEKSLEIYKNSKLCEICKKNANVNK